MRGVDGQRRAVEGHGDRSSPYFCLNSSPARCGVEPVAGCAKLYLPGLAFTRSVSSFIDFAGKSGLTEITLGEAATSVIGAKSFTGSYEIFVYMLGLTMKPVLTTSTV